MSLGDLLSYGSGALIVAGACFIAYRALRLRQALVDQPYRTRALWTAIGAFSLPAFLAAGALDAVFGQVPTTDVGVLVEAAVWGFVFLVVYGWIATNIDVAVVADYINRDPLGWAGGGKRVTIGVILIGYGTASLPSWWWPEQVYQAISSSVGNGFITALFLAATVYSALVLAITVWRILDRRIRNYTKWVVASIVLLFVGVFTSGSGPLTDLLDLAIWVGGLYTMNHTVTALAIRTKILPS